MPRSQIPPQPRAVRVQTSRMHTAHPEVSLARVDVAALKRNALIEEVVGRYGVELRSAGRALVGRCPFHDDQGRANLYIYPDTDSYYCYRCNVGGDAIDFVERIEHVDFRGAVERLSGRWRTTTSAARMSQRHAALPRRGPHNDRAAGTNDPAASDRAGTAEAGQAHDVAERACLAAAVELYENQLRAETRGREYIEARGLHWSTAARFRLGYAGAQELADFLRWRRPSLAAARRAGLLTADGREVLAGRIVVPEIRDGDVYWLIGRAIDPDMEPRYLGLRGKKPLLGWEAAGKAPAIVLVEGVFDVLVLHQWEIPALALVGTHARPDIMASLARFERVYVALDRDDAGAAATATLLLELGPRAVPVTLPAIPGVKDVADLALLPDGQRLFARVLLEARQHPSGMSVAATGSKAPAPRPTRSVRRTANAA